MGVIVSGLDGTVLMLTLQQFFFPQGSPFKDHSSFKLSCKLLIFSRHHKTIDTVSLDLEIAVD